MIILTGSYGHSNFGDCLLKESAKAILDEALPDHDVSVMQRTLAAGTPADAEMPALGVPALALRQAEALVYGGGTLFSRSPRRTGAAVLFPVRHMLAAVALGTPVSLLGIGLGALSPFEARVVRAALATSAICLLRDDESVRRRARGHQSLPRVDLVELMMSRDSSEDAGPNDVVDYSLRSGGTARRVGFAVSETECRRLRGALGSSFEQTCARMDRVIAQLLDGDGVAILSGPLDQTALVAHFPHTLGSCRATIDLATEGSGEGENPLAAAGDQIGDLDGLVTMRYHPMMIAMARRVPTIATGADPKLAALAAKYSTPRRFLAWPPSDKDVNDWLDGFWSIGSENEGSSQWPTSESVGRVLQTVQNEVLQVPSPTQRVHAFSLLLLTYASAALGLTLDRMKWSKKLHLVGFSARFTT